MPAGVYFRKKNYICAFFRPGKPDDIFPPEVFLQITMAKKRNALDYFLLWIKGIAMGTANKVPGVSGGTVAFVIGFYEEFIFSLQRINRRSFKWLLYGHVRSFFRYTNMWFLLCILGGTITSFFSVSLLIDYLIEHYSVQVWAVFFGMVLGSLLHLIKKYDSWRGSTVRMMLLGLFIGISVTMLDYRSGSDNMAVIFLCGVISVCGMTLPGLSGSFLLMVIGNYKLLMVDSVNAVFFAAEKMLRGDYSALYDVEQMHLIKICGVFTAGTLIGVVIFSHILGYLLKHHRANVIALIIGFIGGSLSIMWPWKNSLYERTLIDGQPQDVIIGFDHYLPALNQPGTWIAVAFVLLGFWGTVKMETYSERKRAIAAGTPVVKKPKRNK